MSCWRFCKPTLLLALMLTTPRYQMAGPIQTPVSEQFLLASPAVSEKNKVPTPLSAPRAQPALPRRAVDLATLEITPLHWAAAAGDTISITSLIQGGASVAATESLFGGETPLHWAAYAGEVSAVRLLLESGATVDASDDDGQTPLHEALYDPKGDNLALLALLTSGADPNLRVQGFTPLHYVTLGQDFRGIQAVLVLRLFGADANARDEAEFGLTPLHTAVLNVSNHAYSMVSALLSAEDSRLGPGADANASDNRGLTALHMAAGAVNGSPADVRIVNSLLTYGGADVNATDVNGATPLDYAVLLGHESIATVLRLSGGETRVVADPLAPDPVVTPPPPPPAPPPGTGQSDSR